MSDIFNTSNNIKFRGNLLGYFITITSLLFTTSPFFGNVVRDFAAGLIIFLLLVVQIKGLNVFNTRVFLFMGLIYGLIIIQGFLWGFSLKAALFYPILTIYLPYLIFTILRTSYFKYFFNVIYFTAIYTLILWFLQSISTDIDAFFLKAANNFFEYGWDKWPRSLIFYTTGQDYAYNRQLGVYRNSGIFHEPGAYSIFLMIAIIINTVHTKDPLNKKNIFLSFVVLTTFSTVGYIMLFVLAVYALPKSQFSPVMKFIIIITLIVLTINVYNTSYFLRDKLVNQFNTQSQAYEQGEITRGRFFSMYSSLKVAVKYPLTGRDILVSSNVKEEIGEGGSFGYGFIGIFAKFGLIFSILYLWFFYRGLRNLCILNNLNKQYAIIFFIVINLGLLTQVFILNNLIVIFFLTGFLIHKKQLHVQSENIADHRGYGLIR